MQDRVAFYNKRIDSKKLEVEKLNRNYNSISLLRILTVISAIFFEVFCYTRRDLFFGIVLFVLHIILFLFLVKIHEKIYINKERVKGFIELNKKEIDWQINNI